MYIITRRDLHPGQQAVQSIHAMRQFTAEHSEIDRSWFENSNYLGLLSVANEDELEKLIYKASSKDIRFSVFREPDIGNKITAIALEPCDWSRRLCSSLRLALK